MEHNSAELIETKHTVLPAAARSCYKGAAITVILALVIAIAVTLVALNYKRNLNGLIKTINTNSQLMHQQIQQLQGIQVTLAERLNQQQQQLVKNQQLESGNQHAWIMAEVNYLIRLASYNLNYSRDFNAAIVLLQTADQRVAQLNDPALNQLRQQLANMITTLQPIAKMDLVGALAKLSALQRQVKALPLVTPPAFTVAKENTDTAAPQTAWRKALANSLATLKSMIIIRHHQEPVEPLLNVEQLHYLQQNLQLQLQQAQWAVLHGQQTIYQASLQQAMTWVQNYFASKSPQTSAFLESLAQLQKIAIQPVTPDMSALLNTLARAEQTFVVRTNTRINSED